MWYNGNDGCAKKKKTKKVKGSETNKYGWKTNNKRHKPLWKTCGITKVEKRNLNYLIDEYDEEILKEDEDYFKHHETLHSLSVNWQTGADPRDKFRDQKVTRGNKKGKNFSKGQRSHIRTFRGSIDCFKPETFDFMKSKSRRRAKNYAEYLRQDKIRNSYDRLKRNVYDIRRPKHVKKKNASKTYTVKMQTLKGNLINSRRTLKTHKDQQFAKTLSKSIRSILAFESKVSKRRKSTDTYLQHVKSRKVAQNKIKLIKKMYNGTYEHQVEEQVIEKDFMELTLDEMHKKVVVDKTAFINFDEYDDQGGKEEKCKDKKMQQNDDHEEVKEDDSSEGDARNGSTMKTGLEAAALIRDLQIDIGKIMSVEKLYKIRDLRNFFYEIISRYDESTEKLIAQKAIYEICANLDIMAVGKLVMQSPEKLPLCLYSEKSYSV